MRGDGWILGALLGAAGLIAATQLPLRATSLTLKETSEAYLLPPPPQLVVWSLGHRAALADLLWANVLVTQGMRVEQRRRFETVGPYLDAIIELDPKWREPYRLADTLLTFQAVEVPLSEVYKAREVLERGVKERPTDAELWLQLGQFVAFIAAPSYLKDPEEQERWRREGAEYLGRAAELGGGDVNIQWQAFGGAGILRRAGKTTEAIAFLERLAMTTDDEELRQKAEAQLQSLQAQDAAMQSQIATEMQRQVEVKQQSRYLLWTARKPHMQKLWRAHYPGRKEEFLLVAGPPQDAAACAGGSASKNADDARCAPDWAAWAERINRLSPE